MIMLIVLDLPETKKNEIKYMCKKLGIQGILIDKKILNYNKEKNIF